MTNEQRAGKIVKAIIVDIEDRKGLGNAWEEIDDEVQQEIREAWTDIILKQLEAK